MFVDPRQYKNKNPKQSRTLTSLSQNVAVVKVLVRRSRLSDIVAQVSSLHEVYDRNAWQFMLPINLAAYKMRVMTVCERKFGHRLTAHQKHWNEQNLIGLQIVAKQRLLILNTSIISVLRTVNNISMLLIARKL